MKHPWENDKEDAIERKEKGPTRERESEGVSAFQARFHVHHRTCFASSGYSFS